MRGRFDRKAYQLFRLFLINSANLLSGDRRFARLWPVYWPEDAEARKWSAEVKWLLLRTKRRAAGAGFEALPPMPEASISHKRPCGEFAGPPSTGDAAATKPAGSV
jgi:hypothetical protein